VAVAVARASDDHTLGALVNGNLTSARLLNPRLPFDPARDFSPLSLLATAPLVLVGTASELAGADFLRAARKCGAACNYGSVGVGLVGHQGMELLKARVGFVATHVPYNGNPAVMTMLLREPDARQRLFNVGWQVQATPHRPTAVPHAFSL